MSTQSGPSLGTICEPGGITRAVPYSLLVAEAAQQPETRQNDLFVMKTPHATGCCRLAAGQVSSCVP